jgi:hypothetical protein
VAAVVLTSCVWSNPSSLRIDNVLNTSSSSEDFIYEANSFFEPTPQRFFPVVVAPKTGGDFALFRPEVKRQATWDPCRPIYFTVNPENETVGARAQLTAAIAEIEQATGLNFVFAGETDEKYSVDREDLNFIYPEINSYWSPILIVYLKGDAWAEANRNVFGDEGEETIAFAGALPMKSRGLNQKFVYVTGHMVFSAEYFESLVEEHLAEDIKSTMMHELGHVVGLDHVGSTIEMMHESDLGQKFFATGDRRGLALQGSGACLKDSLYPH